ncbi:MAG: hypothetical protein EAZ40_12395 [Rhodobacterales bacterium]|nr:MAG: hypothetical protein EAZ40_12395 [Rhodobacterales bacterium]
MTSESKILTVSYGTFSCTLEGFDDPFNTMKAIAEYFRDLTAEDRYFGAEPPQPDAAMLHRIAEREVSRLVDARVRENGVHLRPQDSDAAVQAPGPATQMPVTPMPAAEMAPAPAPVEPSLQDAIPEGVAAKLARVRQSVTIEPAVLGTEDLAEAIADVTEAAKADAAVDPVPAADPDRFSSDALRQLEALLRAPADAPQDLPEPSDAMAWLDAEEAADLATDKIPADDLGPMGLVGEDPAALEEATDNLFVEDLAEDGLVAEAAIAASAGHEDLSADTAPDLDPVLDPALEDALLEAAAAEEALEDLSRADAPATLTEALLEDPLPEATAIPEAAPQPAETARPAGRSKRVNSRVVRLHPEADEDDRSASTRAATGLPEIGGDDAEVARLLRQTDDELADDENRRRLESIAHLKAAVLATEADRAFTGEVKPAPDTRADSYKDDLAQVVQPDDAPPAPEAAPPAPEVKPRRKTVSVRPQEPRPGTIRPGMMGPPPLVLVSEQRIDRLQPVPEPAPVVEPAPAPAAASVVPEVPAPAAAAPAMAEQVAAPITAPREGQPMVALRTGRLTGAIGIGAAAPSPHLPQKKIVLDQPSQGMASDADDEEDLDEHLSATEEAGLAEFAERVGVKSMAEMLEAAAAYATCIEKRSQFTRPQLMRRLMASAGSRQVSREDGLRSFGTLLRTGRIEKVSRGHYMLAETSPYLAEARRLS